MDINQILLKSTDEECRKMYIVNDYVLNSISKFIFKYFKLSINKESIQVTIVKTILK